MGLPEKRTPPPILKTLQLATGGTLEWKLRDDGGVDLGYNGTTHVTLTEQEFRWFLDDITKPAGPVYRGGVQAELGPRAGDRVPGGVWDPEDR